MIYNVWIEKFLLSFQSLQSWVSSIECLWECWDDAAIIKAFVKNVKNFVKNVSESQPESSHGEFLYEFHVFQN